MPALVPEVPAAMLHSVLGGSRRGSALQAAVGNLHWNLQHIRGRLRDPAADGDPITSAIEDVLGQAEPPGDEEAVTACLLCRTIGPCLSVECPRTHSFRIPVTGQVPVILTTLKKALCAALPDQASLLNPVPELPLAQAFIIVELWVSALLDHKHRLKDDVLVSPPIWTGCDLLVLLTSYRDPAVVPAGRVGVLLSSRQSSIPEAAAVPLPRLKEEWCADPWLSFDLCPRCDRPRLQRLVLTQPCDPARPPVMPVCGALPKGSTVTRRMARCSNIRVSGLSGASAFSLSTAACHLCSPGVCDLQPPGDDNLYRQLRARHDGSYIPKFDALPTGIARLLVFTINAGGLASKMRMLLALLVDFEPDVVCLQEAGPLFVDDSLKGVPYRVILGPVVPGGGLAILIHHRLQTRAPLQSDKDEHALSVAIPVSEKVPVVVTNVHFPPGMKAANRRLSILRSAAFQARHPGGVKLVAGDMNADLADDSGAWLRKACTDNRYWGGFTHLYRPGEATNIVANRAGVSRRELDWVLVSAQSPVHACEKFLLPGLSTHLAVACDLSVRSEYLSQANPAGRLFRFRRAEPSHMATAAAMASLAFWWAWCARLSPDGAFTWYWECISGIIPSSSSGFRLAAEAAAKLFEGTQLAARDRLTAWWADRQDAAFLRAVQLTEGKLQGTGVTSVTAAALKIRKARFQQLSSVSPDGEYFPTEPDAFKEELLRQAMELHCGRHIGSDAGWLRRLADQYRPRMSDRPDITAATRLAHAQRGERAVDPRAPATSGSPPSFQEMHFEIRRSGSEAAAFGELVQSLQSRLSGTAIGVLVELLHATHSGAPARILNAVLHLCLLKKEPQWLVRMSRPVMLEEPVRRKESTAIFHRLQMVSTVQGLDPPSAFAYRKEFSSQLVAIFCRWAIPVWIRERGRLWVFDWDESNAFCNVQRESLQQVCPDGIRVDPWYQSFYGRLSIYVQSPYGLVGPYRMLHGGAQGDSMGVGGFKELGSVRSRANAAIVANALRPETGGPGGPDPADWCPVHPACAAEYVPEVSSSDDRRIFAYTDAGAAYVLRVSQKTCLAGGGAINRSKLKGYLLVDKGGALGYAAGQLSTVLGVIKTDSADLAMVKIPVVMGEPPRAVLVKYEEALRHLHWAVPRTEPVYALALRVVTTFALTKADFVLDVVPAVGLNLEACQRLSDGIHRRALGLPRSFPRTLLYRPLRMLGLHAPRLQDRHAVRFVHTLLGALNCRSSYVADLLRHELGHKAWVPQAYSDAHVLHSLLEAWQLQLVLLPAAHVPPTAMHVSLHRAPEGPQVVVASDGACGQRSLAYAAVLADARGVFAEAWSAVAVEDPYPWAAEWFGRYLGLAVLREMRLPLATRVLALADNTHVTTEGEDHTVSDSPYVDNLRVQYAAGLHLWQADEVYVPAQQDFASGAPSPAPGLAGLQHRAHSLATSRMSDVEEGPMPFAADVGGVAVLTTGGVPYLRHSVAMERRYEQLAPAMPHLDALLHRDPAAGTSWERVVQEARLSKDALNVATWLRAARTMATAPDNVFNCPFCEQSCAGWGQHLLAACGKVALAVQAGFRALVLAAAPGATVPEWVTTTWVRLGRPSGDSLHLVLRADHEVTATWPPARPHTVYVTWSGMLMGTCAEASRWLTAARRDSLVSAYLEALATYARSAAWDLFWTTSNGPVSGWTHGLSWQHAACLSALLHLYDRAVTALAESPGLGVAAHAEPEFPLGSDGQHCSVLVVIGGGQAPAWEGAAVHRWSLARLDAQPEHVHVRVGDRFWMSAPEGTVPQGLAEALMALSAVVPSSSTVVRARGDPDAPPGGSGSAASE